MSATVKEVSKGLSSQKRCRIGVFVDHDIMIRHFLKSGAFDSLAEHHDLTLVFPQEGNKRITQDVLQFGALGKIRRINIPDARRLLWARLTQVYAMRLPMTEHARYLRRAWRRTMNWRASWFHTFLALPGVRQLFQSWLLQKIKAEPNVELDLLLDAERFDVVINPGVPIGVFIEDLTIACNERNIPFIHIMNSWDNPSLAILPAGHPDYYAVWGQQTKEHAIEYLGMSPERVVKLGAAQFDIFRAPPRVSRRQFAEEYDIDHEIPILLYAGGSLGTNEFAHLQFIEQLIDEGKLPPLNILYRPHPWGGGGNAGDQIITHDWRHVKIERTMREYLLALTEKGYHMTFPDYSDTHDLLASVDYVVSPLSTIIIEAALHGKPVLCYLPLEDKNAEHFQAVYDLPHFRGLVDDPNVLVANGKAELANRLAELTSLETAVDFSERITKTSEFFVEPSNERYRDRLLRFIEHIAQDVVVHSERRTT